MRRPISLIALSLALTGPCAALSPPSARPATDPANWPQWRGPFFNGSTTTTGLPASWSGTTNTAWVTPLPGPAASTPIVWGERVFLTSLSGPPAPVRRGAPGRVLGLCIDARTGTILWRRALGANRQFKGEGGNAASPSACTDGQTVFFLTGTGSLSAFDFAGTRLWARDLEKDYGPFVILWGYHSSPLLYGDRLYIVVMQNKNPTEYRFPAGRQAPLPSFLLALDPNTGSTLWQHVRPTDATGESSESYISPVPYEHDARSEIILVGGECLTGHAADTGRELWRWAFMPHDGKDWQRTAASPVPGPGLIYAVRPQHRGLFAVKAGGTGRLGAESLGWPFLDSPPDVASPALDGDRLYVLNGKAKVMTCLDAKGGQAIWQGKLRARAVFRASPLVADGKIYCISEAGDIRVLAAGDQFKILAELSLADERPCRSSIIAAAGRLYIRTAKNLYCLRLEPAQE